MISYERETKEFQQVSILIDGLQPLTANVSVSIVLATQRPTVWVPLLEVDSVAGFWVEDLAPGLYKVYVQVTNGGEVIVRDIGHVTVT